MAAYRMREYEGERSIFSGTFAFARDTNNPFDSNWAFSNAVIEHVGNWRRQQLFAAEIRRVARTGYFVTTPNLYFPIEPHALLPLYQFYPVRLKRWALRFSPGYMRQVEEINLLTRAKLRKLFPEARVISVNFASGLIAYHATSFSAHS